MAVEGYDVAGDVPSTPAGSKVCCARVGNHEFNAIGFVTPDPAAGGPDCLRSNRMPSDKAQKNRDQHVVYLEPVVVGWLQRKVEAFHSAFTYRPAKSSISRSE